MLESLEEELWVKAYDFIAHTNKGAIPSVKEISAKFADLIILECLKVAQPDDSHQDEWFKAKTDSCNKIRERFKV
jgi:hypothetical protein